MNKAKMAIHHARSHEWKRALFVLFFVRKSSIDFSWGDNLGRGQALSPDYRNIHIFVPPNTPFLLPVPIIDDAIIMNCYTSTSKLSFLSF